MEDVGARTADWLATVRRARLGRTVKAVAFALATYANNDGTKVFPGIARMAVECELSTKAVKEAMGKLRDAGLIEVVRAARRPGESNEYRLIHHPDLLDRVELPSPAAHEVAIARVADSVRGRYVPKHLRGTAVPADAPVDEPVDAVCLRGTGVPADINEQCSSAGNGTAPKTASAGNGTANLRGTAFPPTSQGPLQISTSHNGRDLRTAVTVPGAIDPEACDGCRRGFVLTGEDIESCFCVRREVA